MILNDLKTEMISLLQKSNITIEGIYYVVKDVLEEVKQAYDQALQNETQQRLKEISEVDNKQGPSNATTSESNNGDNKSSN